MTQILLPPRYLEEAAYTAIAKASEARADAQTAALDRALVQVAMEQIAAISVPALPHLLDGLMPIVLISVPSGAVMLNGQY